jgi:hypothetical protein
MFATMKNQEWLRAGPNPLSSDSPWPHRRTCHIRLVCVFHTRQSAAHRRWVGRGGRVQPGPIRLGSYSRHSRMVELPGLRHIRQPAYVCRHIGLFGPGFCRLWIGGMADRTALWSERVVGLPGGLERVGIHPGQCRFLSVFQQPAYGDRTGPSSTDCGFPGLRHLYDHGSAGNPS